MQQSELNYDKLLKPITKTMETLTRDKERKKEYAKLAKEVDALEKATREAAKSASVIDEKSFDTKKGLLNTLKVKCEAADKEVQNVSKGSKKGENPVFAQLQKALDAYFAQITSSLKEFSNWFKEESKPGEFEIKVPRNATDMIEMVQTGGMIGLPSDQSFDATITLSYSGFPELGAALKKSEREFIVELGRVLAPLKKQVAKAFDDWNSEYAEYEAKYDQKNAKALFDTINSWFKDTLKVKATELLQAAADKVVKGVCAQPNLKDAAKQVKVDVHYDGSNIAKFVLKFPDNPANEISKSYESMEEAHTEYTEAVTEIVASYKSLGESIGELQKEMQAAEKKGGKFDPEDRLKKISDATSELETAVSTGTSSCDALSKALAAINTKLNKNKDSLKANPLVGKDYDKSSKDVNNAARRTKTDIPNVLKPLTQTIADLKDLQKSVAALGGRNKPDPTDKDRKSARDAIAKVSSAFSSIKPGALEEKLTVPDLDNLDSLLEEIKT